MTFVETEMKRILTIALFTAVCFFNADGNCGIERTEGPVKLASGDGFAIHMFSGSVQENIWISHVVHTGIVILHTDLITGKVTWLIHTGTFQVPTRRISFSISRLLGLYLTKTHIAAALYNIGKISDRLPKEPPLDEGTYCVIVFKKQNEKKIFNLDLDLSAGRPERVPIETTELGILKRTEDGFSVFGNRFIVQADASIEKKGSLQP